MHNAQPALNAQVWSSAEVLILDLDGTLHTDRHFLDVLHSAFIHYVGRAKGWSADEVETRLHRFRDGGWRGVAPSAGEFAFLASAGVDLDGWLDRAEMEVSIARRIGPNPELAAMLGKVHDTRRIAVTTNSPWKLAMAVLHSLRITEHTDLVACPRHPAPAVPFPELGKPSVELYASIMRYFNVRSGRVLVAGDRQEIDINPADELGLPSTMVDENQPLIGVLRALQ
ncbi:MAG TPA: HAD family hydrolase [Streptosporangiaceae bacterium]